jgi:hypothetical protein
MSRRLVGTGCVLVSTLQKTYPLILQGDERSYSTLWSSILTTAVKKMMPVQWRFPYFPRKDEPMALEFSAVPMAAPLVSAGGIQLHPEQHMQLRSQWKSVFWPGKPGWTSFERAGAPPVSAFIYGPDDWKGVQLMERLKNTRLIADGAKQGPAIHKEFRESVRTVPGICFMLIFLICCGFLWYETKILSR